MMIVSATNPTNIYQLQTSAPASPFRISPAGTLLLPQGAMAVKRFSLLLSKHNPSCIYLHIYLHFAVFLVRKEQATEGADRERKRGGGV